MTNHPIYKDFATTPILLIWPINVLGASPLVNGSAIISCVTPCPREYTVHDTVGVYKSTKCHIEIILETKVGNERLWNPKFVVFKPRVQLSFSKKI